MKRALKWAAIGFCMLIVVLLAGVTLFAGAIVKRAVNKYGPELMGVPVTLEKASCSPFAGKIKLTNLHVGNPKGFNTPALFDLGEVDIDLDSASLFSKTISIHKITAIAPHITYEKSMLGSNFSEVRKLMGGDGPEPSGEQAVDAGAESSGRKVVIEQLLIVDPALNVSIRAAGGHYVPVKLGEVELRDIGKDHGGVGFADAVSIIFSVIISNIENALLGAGDLLGSGAKAFGRGAGIAGEAVADRTSTVIKGVRGQFGGDKPADEAKK